MFTLSVCQYGADFCSDATWESWDPPPDARYDPKSLLQKSVWASRGWTMQELLFSKRLLYFTEQGPYWECYNTCRSILTSERLVSGMSICKNVPRAFHRRPWPDIDHFAGVITDYNHRELTYDFDVLRALAGVTASMEEIFPGGFLFGLPVLFFHWALLWDTRRQGRARQLHRSSGQTLPSWSWISMQGELDLELYASACDYILKSNQTTHYLKERGSLTVLPIVQFKVRVNGSQKSELAPLPPTYDLHRTISRSFFAHAPPGWTKRPPWRKKWVSFHHASDPDTAFAFPLPNHSEVQSSTANMVSNHLHFRARRAFFMMSVPARDSFQGGEWFCNHSMLFDTQKRPAGVATVHAQIEEESYIMMNPSQKPRSGEFIAISEGSMQLSKDETRFKTEVELLGPFLNGKYEFYNVLYISRRDGIAYREALGRVKKLAWEAANPKEIDVVLG